MIVEWKGRVRYAPMLQAQREYRERVIAGEAPSALWLLEHEPVVTLGRRGGVVDTEAAAAAGYDVVETERGGLATVHEPGQLVGYLIADIRKPGIRRVVEALEDGIIAWLGGEGIVAGRREGYPGVWVGAEKICAVGLNVRMGVTLHGFALNLVNDLRGFRLIVPCGITDGGVTTLARVRGFAPAPALVAHEVAASVLDALGGIS